MPYSKITLYKQPIMTKEKNFIIEDFETYLATLDKLVVDKVQYIKPQLENVVKLSQLTSYWAQTQFGMKTASSSYISYFNYMKIEYYAINEDDEEFETNQECGYYFINHWTWKAQNTAEISITMDVLNTIGVPSATNKYCNWDEKTLISREHQDRYRLDAESNPCWYIDKKTEGITAYQYKTRDQIVLESAQHTMKWYFVWRNTTDDPLDSSSLIDMYLVPEWSIDLTTGSDSPITLTGIKQWNLKVPAIVKVVELPYCPSDKFINDGSDDWHIAAADWTNNFTKVGSNSVKVINPYFVFSNEFSPYLDSTTFDHIDPLYNQPISTMISDFTDDPQTDKSQDNEPKLYHSDYYQVKYLYDSVGKTVRFEEFDFTEDDDFSIKFCPSRAVSSKSLFMINAEQWINGKEDFYKYLASNRNNDVPLESYGYYTYLFSQAGWDQFKMDLQAGKTIGGVALKAATGIGIPQAIGDLFNLGMDRMSAEANVESMKDSLKNQNASVAGSDDLDLFNEYSGNKLHKIRYEVSRDFKKLLFDLFYYNGYIQNRMGVPDTTSRYWFNYVRCTAVLKNVLLNLPEGVWDEYKNKWSEGATVFHKHKIDTVNVWDINQEYENLESDLL